MLRGALKALFWMQEPPTRTVVLRTLDAAKDEAAAWLNEAGVSDSRPPFHDDPAVHGERLDPSVFEPG